MAEVLLLIAPLVAAFITVFGSLLAVIDPFAAIPPVLGLTQGLPTEQRRRILTRASLFAAVALLIAAVAGGWLLRLLGLTPLAFRIAGAAVFAGMGWEMIHAQVSAVSYTPAEMNETQEHQITAASPGSPAANPEDLAYIPLAMPLLAGPGAISSVIAQMGHAVSLMSKAGVCLAIIAACATSWFVLIVGVRLDRRIGQTGLNIITRLAGLFLLAMSAQWAIDSWRELQLPVIAG